MEVDLGAIDMGQGIPNIDNSRKPTVLDYCSVVAIPTCSMTVGLHSSAGGHMLTVLAWRSFAFFRFSFAATI